MKNIKSPVAFFDTLEEMPNPFKEPVKSLDHLLSGYPQDAIGDYQHASEFIFSYRGSPDTFSTYRREIEHFLHWCWLIAKKSLSQIVREDIEEYVEFARTPPPSCSPGCGLVLAQTTQHVHVACHSSTKFCRDAHARDECRRR